GMFVNTLALRNYPYGEKVFRAFLKELEKRTLAAFENQDYQFEALVDRVVSDRDPGRNPLFDVVFAFQNVIPEKPSKSGLRMRLRRYESTIAKFDMTFFVKEIEQCLSFELEYCTKLFKEDTIKRFIDYFRRIVSQVIAGADKKIGEIEIISEEEKREILNDFNDTKMEFLNTRTIPELFQEQVENGPDKIALVGGGIGSGFSHLTYRELNKRANQLARLLRQKGVTPDTTVAVMVERSHEMMIALYAVLKAGAAYLPIDPGYPGDRIRYMLEDSGTRWLLTQEKLARNLDDTGFTGDVFAVEDRSLYFGDGGNLERINTMQDLLYMIYTSGSTGKPKGVKVKIESFMNLLYWYIREFDLNSRDCMLLIAPVSFDLTQKNLYAPLFTGGVLCLSSPGIPDYDELSLIIARELVTMVNCAPSVFYPLLELNACDKFTNLRSLRYVFLGGEPIRRDKLDDWTSSEFYRCEFINTYGPTECTDIASSFRLSREDILGNGSIPIGKPIYNVSLYILSENRQVSAVGIEGELCIGGIGLSRGYHKNPQLNVEKFIETPHLPVKMVYRTGDMAKWLPGGDIEFLGRVDHQVKVRGNRVELEEIERLLLMHPGVKDAVVKAIANDTGDNYLCAYMSAAARADSGSVPDVPGLKEFLTGELPGYMVPTSFMWLDSIPLTPSGKVDRKSLPVPGIRPGEGDTYTAPRNKVEEKLVEIWSVVLGVEKDKIGIDDNFFQLGGHSLKGTVVISRIHKAFNVRLSLADIFQAPDIRRLSAYINASVEDEYFSIEPVEKKEYYPLSSAQKRLYVLDQMEFESTAYNIPALFELSEAPDPERLEAAFKQLIKRHESFRTCFIMVNDEPVQRVMDDADFLISLYPSLTSAGTPGSLSLTSGFIHPFNLSRAPLLRAALMEAAEGRPLLFVDMHHIISDGISMEIFQRELPAAYDSKELPPLKLQYKDFARWQTRESRKEEIEAQEAYWLKMFAGEIPVLNLPFDYARPVVQSFEGSNVSFELGRGETAALKQLAREERATLFMVLAAVFNLLLSKLSGQEDIVVGSPAAGRRHSDLENIIGMFVNTLPMRNQPTGEKCVTDFLQEVKARTLEVFENQDYQFEELVERLSVVRDTGRNPLFDVMFAMQNMETEAAGDTGLKLSAPRYETGISKFDLTLFAAEAAEGLSFELEYSTNLFKEETIQRFIGYFNRVVSLVLENPDQHISEIEIISREEKREILFDFNDTKTNYPSDKTIHQLFQEQAARTPDYTALVGAQAVRHLTYRQFNEETGRLARLLLEEGV
ncbi:MAG: amino acid adenylation domain-containing protein, partial [bacterium]|nr:amino acid adenylation domain-containing protein [bacterium]